MTGDVDNLAALGRGGGGIAASSFQEIRNKSGWLLFVLRDFSIFVHPEKPAKSLSKSTCRYWREDDQVNSLLFVPPPLLLLSSSWSAQPVSFSIRAAAYLAYATLILTGPEQLSQRTSADAMTLRGRRHQLHLQMLGLSGVLAAEYCDTRGHEMRSLGTASGGAAFAARVR